MKALHAPQRPFIAVATLTLLLAACASTPASEISRMYKQVEVDEAGRAPGAGPDAGLLERRAQRARRAREIHAAHGLVSASDYLKAAVILDETDETEDLKLAQTLALEAARLGEPLGYRVAAESIDKQLVKQGRPQRYGTQYEWVPVLKSWRLYVVDPLTTDVERKAMGIPPLAELYKTEERLNRNSKPPTH